MFDVFKSLKPLQIGVLVAVLLGVVGGTYGVYTLISGSGQVALEEDQQFALQAPSIERKPGDVVIEFADGSVARYRVKEELARVSVPGDAVGETPDVVGAIVFSADGSVQPGSKIVVDLRTLRSDEARRDNFLRRNSLESNRFPLAEFVIREVSGLSWPLPESGETGFQLHGDMTLHGVTAPLTWDVIANFGPEGITGRATTRFQFGDFDMSKPSLFFIISVEDDMRLEVDFKANPS
ncbi:MAG: YceI family protein [Chloroflexi bacterium]|nr:YceI family protein [Chloroflexota bacterium]